MNDEFTPERIDAGFKQLAEIAKRQRAERLEAQGPSWLFSEADIERFKNWPLDLDDAA